MLSLQCSFEYAWWVCLYDKETASNINYLLSCFGKIYSKLLAYIKLYVIFLWCISWLPISGCKINVDNIFQLKIALDCFVCVMLELFVCCHLFCACACVKYLILVQGQNHYLSGCLELLNGVGCPSQFVKAIKTPDKHLTIVIFKFFFHSVKMLKLFIIMVTILSWVH